MSAAVDTAEELRGDLNGKTMVFPDARVILNVEASPEEALHAFDLGVSVGTRIGVYSGMILGFLVTVAVFVYLKSKGTPQ